MPHRNLNVIFLAACISVLCYVVHRRAKTAIIVGNALHLIDAHYVDPVDEDELLTAAMNGMTSTLDEHSEFIPREDYESFQDNINQEFAGIGIFVEQPEKGKPVRVITPLVGSPALAAGILPGDLIIRVDGQDVSAMELREVSTRLKGQIGTVVNLSVRRGDQEVDMTVRRDRIELESVIGDYRDENNRWVYHLQDDPAIAYVRLTSFGEKTVRELEDVLNRLDNQFDALVFDLRGNGGGLLHAAVDVSNMFISKGRIVSTRTRGDRIEDQFKADPGSLVDPSKPMAILIDGNSASASEIVAACMQDNRRATIVGTRSYGKGTVQNILPLQYGRSALRLTVARYYRPNGENIHRRKEATEEDQWGVRPDPGMEVELGDDSIEKLAKRWREASYPSLALVDDGDQDRGESEGEDDGGSVESASPENSAATDDDPAQPVQDDPSLKSNPTTESDPAVETEPTVESDSGLMIDPQLRRAVEHLREVLENRSTQATAA